MAKLGCEEFIKPKDVSTWEYADLWLIIPIFYNVKHGVEIFIKTICYFTDGHYNDKSHDINDLFRELKQKIKILNIQPHSDPGGNKITKNDIKNFPDTVDNLEKIISEFLEVKTLTSKIRGNLIILDKKNDLFRFPDSKAAIKVDWESIIDKFTKEELLILKNKIGGLERLFNKAGYIIVCAIQKSKIVKK